MCILVSIQNLFSHPSTDTFVHTHIENGKFGLEGFACASFGIVASANSLRNLLFERFFGAIKRWNRHALRARTVVDTSFQCEKRSKQHAMAKYIGTSLFFFGCNYLLLLLLYSLASYVGYIRYTIVISCWTYVSMFFGWIWICSVWKCKQMRKRREGVHSLARSKCKCKNLCLKQ